MHKNINKQEGFYAMAVKRLSDFNIKNRGLISGLYGNTRNSEYFIDTDLCPNNISKALFLYFKEEGYRVVFYNPSKKIGFYSYVEEDLAVFSGYMQNGATSNGAEVQELASDGFSADGKYERRGNYTSYVPKFNSPMGKLKPRFGPSNQDGKETGVDVGLKANARSLKSIANAKLVSHYPQIYIHHGANTYFYRQSTKDVFDEVFSYSDMHPHDRMIVVFEVPENIKPQLESDEYNREIVRTQNLDIVENQFNELSKVYSEEDRQLKMIVLFGYKTSGQLAGAYDIEHGGQSGVFYRPSFGSLFGLASVGNNNQSEAERAVNMEKFKKNMFCIDAPQEDEIANLLMRKRIVEGLDCTLSPKPFDTLVKSITIGNFKLLDKEGKLAFATRDDCLIMNLNKPDINMKKLIDTVRADNAESQLHLLPGMEKVVNQIRNVMNLILNAQKQKEETGKTPITVYPHLVFMGNPGTGKTTVANLVAQWFREKNVLSKGTFISATVGDIVGQYIGETRIKAQALCERARGGMLFIDEAYGLREDKSGHGANYAAEAIEVLIQYMTKPDFMLVLAGYKHEMEDLLANSNPGLRSRINDDQLIMFDDYEPPVLLQILEKKLTYPMTDEFCESIRMLVEVMYVRRNLKTWGNARSMEQLAAQIYKEFFRQNDGQFEVRHIPEEYRNMISTREKSEKEILKELNELIGLENVKETIKEVYHRLRRNRRRMKAGLPAKEEDLIFIFMGAPGTGKTTVARLLGGILYDLGLLTTNDCEEKKKGDIIGEYQGGTEKNIEKIFNDSIGKTLFIDEAYSLCENNNTSVATQIVGLLTDNRYKCKMALVLAGYPNEMTQFLQKNAGMKRRVKYIIQFDNYTNEELWQILQLNMRKQECRFHNEELCHQLAIAWFGLIPRTADFGNASVSEQLFEMLDKNCGKRLRTAHIEDVNRENEFFPEDFPEAAHKALASMDDRQDAEELQSFQNPALSCDKKCQQKITVDLTNENESRRATCVEHLEHSVGLLSSEGGITNEMMHGTAFIISLHNHYLLTCSHVVEGKTRFTFSISELQFETPARLIWNDSQSDIALLQVGTLPQEARYLRLFQNEKPVGKTTKITLAGYPLGEQVSRNLMINSGEITNYETDKQNNDRHFDTYMSDINATHGNSGGPVVKQSDYNVIGLLQGGFEQVQVRLITDIRQLYRSLEIMNKQSE